MTGLSHRHRSCASPSSKRRHLFVHQHQVYIKRFVLVQDERIALIRHQNPTLDICLTVIRLRVRGQLPPPQCLSRSRPRRLRILNCCLYRRGRTETLASRKQAEAMRGERDVGCTFVKNHHRQCCMTCIHDQTSSQVDPFLINRTHCTSSTFVCAPQPPRRPLT